MHVHNVHVIWFNMLIIADDISSFWIFQCLLYHMLPSGSESETTLCVCDGQFLTKLCSIEYSSCSVLLRKSTPACWLCCVCKTDPLQLQQCSKLSWMDGVPQVDGRSKVYLFQPYNWKGSELYYERIWGWNWSSSMVPPLCVSKGNSHWRTFCGVEWLCVQASRCFQVSSFGRFGWNDCSAEDPELLHVYRTVGYIIK